MSCRVRAAMIDKVHLFTDCYFHREWPQALRLALIACIRNIDESESHDSKQGRSLMASVRRDGRWCSTGRHVTGVDNIMKYSSRSSCSEHVRCLRQAHVGTRTQGMTELRLHKGTCCTADSYTLENMRQVAPSICKAAVQIDHPLPAYFATWSYKVLSLT